ncbi:hypothetical protein C8J56DRAFT_1043943 [Mycena floridula]|nr:hypothetical protein C8J56DRAFT_1043943 [Mycena floridula]
MVDKGKGTGTSTPIFDNEILSALLDHIDNLTLQVAALSGALTGDQGVSVEADDRKIEDEEKSDIDDAEKKSADDDDGDTVVVPSHQGCQASDMYAASVAASSSSQAPAENPHFLTCPECQHRFPPPPPHENWYAVTRGTQVGVFNDWNDAARHVVGVKGAVFKRYGTRIEAEAAFDAALAKGSVQVIA